MRRAEIILELRALAGAEQDAGDGRLGEQPGERHLRDAGLVRGGNPAHLIDQLEPLLLIEGEKIETGIAIVRIGERSAIVFAGEEARRERAPDREAETVAAHHRNDVAL